MIKIVMETDSSNKVFANVYGMFYNKVLRIDTTKESKELSSLLKILDSAKDVEFKVNLYENVEINIYDEEV